MRLYAGSMNDSSWDRRRVTFTLDLAASVRGSRCAGRSRTVGRSGTRHLTRPGMDTARWRYNASSLFIVPAVPITLAVMVQPEAAPVPGHESCSASYLDPDSMHFMISRIFLIIGI